MTDQQSNSLDMFLAVNKFYLANQTLMDGVPARALAFGQLGTNIVAINLNVGAQSASTKGVTQDKGVLRNGLNMITFAILAPSRAWAISVSNNTLAEQFHTSESHIGQIKDDTIIGYCQMRLGLVSDNLVAMADHGITQVLVDTWADAISDFDGVIADPRQAIVTRKQKTANLRSLFTQTAKLFKDALDPLMVPIKFSHSEIYGMYLGARVIINRHGQGNGGSTPTPPTTDAVINGFTFNSNDNEPIVGVNILANYPQNAAGVQGVSISNGVFKLVIDKLGPAETTTVSLVAQKDMFEDTDITLEIEAGKIYQLSVPMVPIVPPPPPPAPEP